MSPDAEDENVFKMSQLSYQEFCAQKQVIDNHPALRNATKCFSANRTSFLYREVFCVFDTRYYRLESTYFPEHVPHDYCTSLIYSSAAMFHDRVQWRRPAIDADFVSRLTAPPSRPLSRKGKIAAVYLTLGGQPEDNANFTKVLRDDERLARFTWSLATFLTDHGFQGLHLDWDHPRGLCGDPNDTQNLVKFFRGLRRLWQGKLLLSVPPVPEKLRYYALDRLLPLLQHVVVSTHRLREKKSIVDCTNPGDVTARILRHMRETFPDNWERFIYSVSLGADTFVTEGPPYKGAKTTEAGQYDYNTRQAGKTRYGLVCRLTVVERNADPECAVGYDKRSVDAGRGAERQKVKVAAFARPKEIRARLRRAYEVGLGDTPVVVYNIDLDDFEGDCDAGVMSPQLEAYATATYES